MVSNEVSGLQREVRHLKDELAKKDEVISNVLDRLDKQSREIEDLKRVKKAEE